MKRLAVIIALLLLIVVPIAHAGAQPNPEIERLVVEIWPEYDKPSALVIFRVTLPAVTSFPVQLSLRIPREAGQPYNVAMQDVDNLLYNLNYTSAVEGDWLRLTMTAASPNLQVEYYDPRITKNNTARSFEFRWQSDYKVRNFSWRVQQPANASQMAIQPSQGSPTQESDGLTYFSNQIGAVEASTLVKIQLNYTKPDDKLSVDLIAPQPKAANPGQQPAVTTGPGGISVEAMLMVLAAVLIAGGLVWFFLQRRQAQELAAESGRRRHTPARSPAPYPAANGGGQVYCHKCGKQSQSGDVFCRACGTRLRN